MIHADLPQREHSSACANLAHGHEALSTERAGGGAAPDPEWARVERVRDSAAEALALVEARAEPHLEGTKQGRPRTKPIVHAHVANGCACAEETKRSLAVKGGGQLKMCR